MTGPENEAVDHGVDTLVPAEVARKAERTGAQKARMDFWSLLVLAILGGAFIALGAMFATTVLAGAAGHLPFGLSRLFGGVAFCLGLILVVVGGAELFTGNTLMVMALASKKIRAREMLRAWAIVYLGNFIGAIGLAALVFLAGQYRFGEGSVAQVALKVAVDKVETPFVQAFFLGILCNLLVCLAVWLSFGARTTTDRVLAVIFPVSAFVAAGLEHSVANMYFIPLALFIKQFAPAEMWAQVGPLPFDLAALGWSSFLVSLIPVTLGNIFGGAALVGAVYWFVYLRPRSPG